MFYLQCNPKYSTVPSPYALTSGREFDKYLGYRYSIVYLIRVLRVTDQTFSSHKHLIVCFSYHKCRALGTCDK